MSNTLFIPLGLSNTLLLRRFAPEIGGYCLNLSGFRGYWTIRPRHLHGITTFICDICKATFAENGNLKSHIGSVHEGKKPFKCDICSAKFTENGSLKKHIALVHEGKKPFKCAICDAKFSRKPYLNSHIASAHELKMP